MNKKLGSFISTLVTTLTIFSIVAIKPVYAETDKEMALRSEQAQVWEDAEVRANGGFLPVTVRKGPEWETLLEANKKGTVSEVYFSGITNPDGTMTDTTAKGMLRYNIINDLCSDEDLKGYVKRECEEYGLDLNALLAERDALRAKKRITPSLCLGWAKNQYGIWSYSENGVSWLTNTFKQIDNETYYFNSFGQAVTGWQTINNEQYFFYKPKSIHTECSMARWYIDSNGIVTKRN